MGHIKEEPAEPSSDGAAETDAEGEISEDRAEMLAVKNIRGDGRQAPKRGSPARARNKPRKDRAATGESCPA